ncbi:MAG: MTH938/NDUFAF3 family protein [Steroidobacteraceae bacterium]
MRAYAPGEVQVGARVLREPFLLAAQALQSPLGAATPADLTTGELLERLRALQAEVVIVGAASGFPQLPPAWRAALLAQGVGVEGMVLGAACRTYNLLVQDGRSVVALLFP